MQHIILCCISRLVSGRHGNVPLLGLVLHAGIMASAFGKAAHAPAERAKIRVPFFPSALPADLSRDDSPCSTVRNYQALLAIGKFRD
jgi:hypothetical protein